MKLATGNRAYRQGLRAETAEANTQRILEAALELFTELPFDQITLAQVSERAFPGLPLRPRARGTPVGGRRVRVPEPH